MQITLETFAGFRDLGGINFEGKKLVVHSSFFTQLVFCGFLLGFVAGILRN